MRAWKSKMAVLSDRTRDDGQRRDEPVSIGEILYSKAAHNTG